MADIPNMTQQALHILDTMRMRRELSPAAAKQLRASMGASEDAYPYYSADGRPYVWDTDTRYTAQAYNARIQREALAQERGADTATRLPLVLWRMPTVGFYYTDAEGRSWASWYGGGAQVCAICRARIAHGYRSPDMGGEPEQFVCTSDVRTYGDSAGKP
jgi:hypothetical protein